MRKPAWFVVVATIVVTGAVGYSYAAQFTVLHAFDLDDDIGGNPLGIPIVFGSTIYGTNSGMTLLGTPGGSFFRLNTDGTGYQTLKRFDSAASGIFPTGTLASDGVAIYGTTYGGAGVAPSLYKINGDGTGFQTIVSFSTLLPALVGVNLYGSTLYGALGEQNESSGQVYRVNVDGTAYQVIDQDNGDAAALPILDGATVYGTINQKLFSVASDGTNWQMLHVFSGGANGSSPGYGPLVQVGSSLYGTTTRGGLNDLGVIYGINTDGSGFQVLHSFAGGLLDGDGPVSGLTQIGDFLYGVTPRGGQFGLGTIFQIKVDGTGFTLLHSFDGNDGSRPLAGLFANGVQLYGAASSGGPTDGGTIYVLTVPEPPSFAMFGAAIVALTSISAFRSLLSS